MTLTLAGMRWCDLEKQCYRTGSQDEVGAKASSLHGFGPGRTEIFQLE